MNLEQRLRGHRYKPPSRMQPDVQEATQAGLKFEDAFRVKVVRAHGTLACAQAHGRALIKRLHAWGPKGYNILKGPPGWGDKQSYAIIAARQH